MLWGKLKSTLLLVAVTISPILFLLTLQPAWGEGQINLVIEEVEAADFPEIQVHVAVVDEKGFIIEGLGKGNFEITENDLSAPVIEVTTAVNRQAKVTTALVIDTTGSMTGKALKDIKTAVNRAVDLLEGQDEMTIIEYAGEAVVKYGFTSDKTRLKGILNSLESGGSPVRPLDEAVNEATRLVEERAPRRGFVLVLSDGGEAESVTGPGVETTVPIYSIGIGHQVNRKYLQELAKGGGGEYREFSTTEDVTQLYGELVNRLKRRYVIRYMSHLPANSGETHSIHVGVNLAGEKLETRKVFTMPELEPAVHFDNLVPGQTIHGEMDLVPLFAIDNEERITRVEYYIDSELRFEVDVSPFLYHWDTNKVSEGEHVLTVKVYDSTGRVRARQLRTTVTRGDGTVRLSRPVTLVGGALLALALLALVIWRFTRSRREEEYIEPETGLYHPTPIAQTPPPGTPFIPTSPPSEFDLVTREASVTPLEGPPEVDLPSPPSVEPGTPKPLAWLVMTSGERTEEIFRLGEMTTMGRDASNDIHLDVPGICESHAAIRLEKDGYYLCSSDPLGEIKVNETRIAEDHRLRDRDRIHLGSVELLFVQIQDHVTDADAE